VLPRAVVNLRVKSAVAPGAISGRKRLRDSIDPALGRAEVGPDDVFFREVMIAPDKKPIDVSVIRIVDHQIVDGSGRPGAAQIRQSHKPDKLGRARIDPVGGYLITWEWSAQERIKNRRQPRKIPRAHGGRRNAQSIGRRRPLSQRLIATEQESLVMPDRPS